MYQNLNSGLINRVFISFFRLCSERFSELSVLVSIGLSSRLDFRTCPLSWPLWGLKTFSRKSSRSCGRMFFVKPNLKFFGFIRTVFQSVTLIRGMSWVLSVFGTVKGSVVSVLCRTPTFNPLGFCPCVFVFARNSKIFWECRFLVSHSYI